MTEPGNQAADRMPGRHPAPHAPHVTHLPCRHSGPRSPARPPSPLTPRVTTLLILTTTLLTTTCTPSPTATTLRVALWAGGHELEIEQQVADRYEALHPGVRVLLESAPNGYEERLLTSIAAGHPPDVYLLDSPDVPTFVDRGLATDLAPFLDAVGFAADSVFPQVLDAFRRGSSIFALPKDFTPMVIYANRAVLTAAGVETPPLAGWTWDEFRAAAEAVTRDTDGDGRLDVFGFDFPRNLYQWVPFVWSAGGDILAPGRRRRDRVHERVRSARRLRLPDRPCRGRPHPRRAVRAAGRPRPRGPLRLGRPGLRALGALDAARLPRPRGRRHPRPRDPADPAPPVPRARDQRAIRVGVGRAAQRGQPAPGHRSGRVPGLAGGAADPGPFRSGHCSAHGCGGRDRRRGPDRRGEGVHRADRGGADDVGAYVRDFSRIEALAVEIMDRRLLNGEALVESAGDVARRVDEELGR